MGARISKREVITLIQSLGAGVVPRIGLEHIAVGRENEIAALLDDFDNKIALGASSFRLILGRYGSGKSFLCQLMRNHALQRNFIVADADITPERRLTGTKGQGLSLYQELLKNLASRTRPEGNAFPAILERWINKIQNEVTETGLDFSSPNFSKAIGSRIQATVEQMEGMVHFFDYATVINTYWRGYQEDNNELKNAALRWLRGEYTTKTEAKEILGSIRVIIDDSSWYDYIKLLARFVKSIGYNGLVVFLDEAVNLYKISNTIARQNNYDKLLHMLNDVLQGHAEYLGIVISSTPQMIEDQARGLFSNEALKTRLQSSRYTRHDLQNFSGPVIQLNVLHTKEIFTLLQNLRAIHSMNFDYEPFVSDAQIQTFLIKAMDRVGADQFLTPREVIRNFIEVLNLLHQNPEQTFESIVTSSPIVPLRSDPDNLTPETEIYDDESPFKHFRID